MADKETGLNVPIIAEADEKSAKSAVDKLSKGVLSSLKDGCIEVPAELKVPIKGASKDLVKAQEDIIDQLEKMSKKGFSSSTKDLKDLINNYQKFKKLLGQQHKANTKQAKALKSLLYEPIQEYESITKSAKSSKKSGNKKSTKSTTTEQLLQEEIEDAITKEYKRKGYDKFSKELTKGASRAKAAIPGAPTNLGARTSKMDGPYVDSHSIINSDIYGPYRDPKAPQQELERKRIQEYLDATTYKEYQADPEKLAEIDRLIDKLPNKAQNEAYKVIKDALIKDLRKVQNQLMKSTSDASGAPLIQRVLNSLAYGEKSGIDPLKNLLSISGGLEARYDAGVRKHKIGATKGRS